MATDKKIVFEVDTDSAQANIDKLTERINQLMLSQNNLKTTLSNLKKEFKDANGDIEKQALISQQIVDVQQTMTYTSKELAGSKKSLNTEIKIEQSSYAKLNEEYKISAAYAKEVAASEGLQSKASKDASKAANDLNKELKAIDASVGQNQRSVGDYGKALEKLPLGIGGVITGLKGMTVQSLAFLANPIGAVIGALGLALGAVATYFTQTNDGAKLFAKLTASTNAIIQEGIKILGTFGKLITDVFNPKELSKDWEKLKDQVANSGAAITKNAKEAFYWKEQEQKLAKEERIWSEEKVKREGQLAVLALKIRDMNLSPEKQKQAAEQAKKINDELFNHNKIIEERRLKIMEAQEKFQSKKDFQKITDQKNLLSKLEADRDVYLQSLENKESRVDKRIKNSHKKSQDELDKEKREQAKKDLEEAKKKAESLIAIAEEKYTNEKSINDLVINDTDSTNQDIYDATEKNIQALNDLEINSYKEQKDAKLITQEKYNELVSKADAKQALAEAKQDKKENADEAKKTKIDLSNRLKLANGDWEKAHDLRLEQLDIEYKAEIDNANKLGLDKVAIEQNYANEKRSINNELINAQLDAATMLIDSLGKLMGQSTEEAKIAGSAVVLINTYKEMSGIFASTAGWGPAGWALGIAKAASSSITSGLAIQKIWAVDKNTKSAPVTPSVSSVTPPQITATSNITTNSQQKELPIQRVYVLESDITNTQNKVKTIQNKATF